MVIFKNKDEYKQWIDSQDWYQTIELSNGLKTPGKVPTDSRRSFFDQIDFEGKTVLDIGCNSGQYCFWAKEGGATEVAGVDIDTKRINQARILTENEGLDVKFEERSIFDLDFFSKPFDIVFCIAVLTEIQDIFGAIEQLKKVIGKRAFIELDLAKPVGYLAYSKTWLRGHPGLSRRSAVTEVRYSKNGGWVTSPSFDVLCAVFGNEFKLKCIKGGVRYNLVEVIRR